MVIGLVDILRAIGILAFGMFCGWVIYRLMKNADANEENEENEESEENDKRE